MVKMTKFSCSMKPFLVAAVVLYVSAGAPVPALAELSPRDPGGLEYAAAGCGACGFRRLSKGPAVARRWMNDRSPERYLERVEETGVGEAQAEELTAEEHLRERLFTGLRLAAGLDLAALEDDLHLPVRSRFAPQIDRLRREGLAELDGPTLRLTEAGLDLHSEVALRFF